MEEIDDMYWGASRARFLLTVGVGVRLLWLAILRSFYPQCSASGRSFGWELFLSEFGLVALSKGEVRSQTPLASNM